MKVILLAGGFGTRLSEYTDLVPKPMVEIGENPILWHIMQLYACYGHKDFYVALGYKGEVIKDFFSSYHTINSDFSVNLKTGSLTPLSSGKIDWNITLIDTGLKTMTGGRIKRLKKYIGENLSESNNSDLDRCRIYVLSHSVQLLTNFARVCEQRY